MKPHKFYSRGKVRARFLPAWTALVIQIGVSSGLATAYYWDNNGTTAGFGNAGGTWASPTANQWSTDSTGVLAPGASVTTATGDGVNFGSSTAGLGAGTIMVSGWVTNGNITFASGSGAITLAGDTNVLSASPTITVANSADTISTMLAGAGTKLTVGGSGKLFLTGANTFAGQVVIGNNAAATLTLQVNDIESVGVASPLGQPATAANGVIQIGATSRNSTLEFTGAAAAASTDRQVQVGSSATGSGGATILNNNGNPAYSLRFTNVVFNPAASTTSNRQLQLGGTNTGNNEIQGVIGDNSSAFVSLTKNDSGTWILSGANTYTGPTTINGGTLKLSGVGGIASATINVAGGILDVSGTSFTLGSSQTLKGSGVVNGTVTVAAGGSVTGGDGNGGMISLNNDLTFSGTGNVKVGQLTNYDASLTNVAAVNVAGTLTLSGGVGAVTVNLPTAAANPGTYHLIKFGTGPTDATGFVLGTVPASNPRQSGVLQLNGNYLDYVLTGTSPVWTGLQSSEWSTNTIAGSKNWTAGGSPTDYLEGDAVLFDDTATGTHVVDVSVANVNPASVVFNSTNNYTLQGTLGVAGTTVLTKSGSGVLNVNNTNSYTGATTISAGTLNLAGLLTGTAISVNGSGMLTESAGGVIDGVTGLTLSSSGTTNTLLGVNTYSGATTLNSGSTLKFGDGTAGHDGSISNSMSLANNGGATLIYNLYGTVGYGNVISGGGNVTKTGPGTLALLGANTCNGNYLVSGGTLDLTSGRIYANAASQAGLVTVNNGGTLAVANFGQSSATASLGNLMSDATRLVVNGGGIQFNLSGSYGRGFTVGANGATLEVISGVTVAQTQANTNKYATGATLTLTGAGTGSITNAVNGAGVSVVKSGAGSWALSATNTYTGNTTVNAGTLELVVASLATNSTVSVAAGGVLQLDFADTNVVAGFVTNGVSLAPGIYNAANVSPFIAGSGSLQVVPAPSGPTLTSVSPSPVTGSSYPVTLSLSGSGFTGATAVWLTNLTTASGVSYAPTVSSDTSLTVSFVPGTAAAAWNATVVSGSPSAQVGFSVVAPAAVTINSGSLNSAGPGKLVLSGAGGVPGQGYAVLATTSLNSPVVWAPVVTNVFNGDGTFSYTNVVSLATNQLFLRIQQ